MNLLVRLILAGAFSFVLFVPTWWLAGRFQEGKSHPFFRALFAIGLALIGYISFVNLLGRLVGQSILPATIWLAVNLALAGFLWWRRREALSLVSLTSSWRVPMRGSFAASSCRPEASRSQATTRAPTAAAPSANARPMPLAPPVTTITSPVASKRTFMASP